MDRSDAAERELRDLAERFRASSLSRRELLHRAGLLLGGGALTSFLAACGSTEPPKPAAGQQPTSAPAGQPAAAPASKDQPKKGGILKVANPGEPPGLDPGLTTAAMIRDICRHMYEGPLARAANFGPKPMLAESYEVTKDALTHTLVLRKGVKFHNGKEMAAADVVASIKRWMAVDSNGKQAAQALDGIDVKEKNLFVMRFKKPQALLPFYLVDEAVLIMPEETANATGTNPLKEWIGTGPFKFVEHKPDRYVKLARFDDYAARSDEPDGKAGRKIAYFDEIQFLPVSEAAVRADGIGTGEYHFAEELVSDTYPNLKANPDVEPLIVKPGRTVGMFMNKKQGIFTNVKLRRAMQMALKMDPIAQAGFGAKEFWRLHGSIAAPETIWYSEVGKEIYNNPKLDEAKALLKEAGYNGETVRFLASREVRFVNDCAIAIKPQLEALGMKVELVVSDTATFMKNRTTPEIWDAFVTSLSALVHPISQLYMNPAWPSWWESPAKEKILSALQAETDPQKTKQLIDDLQRVVFEEVPVVPLGEMFPLRAASKKLKGYTNPPDMHFWNSWLG